MAAQERAKQAQNAPGISASTSKEEETPPAYTDDLLMMDNVQPPPPAFDAALLPPPTEHQLPPPVFNDSLLPPTTIPRMVFDPLAPTVNTTMMAPPQPSAPSFEDLDFLGGQTIMQPPPPAPAEPDAEIIMGFEGLSPEEKHELLEEQKRIMASIEANKTSNVVSAAAARADAFEQRSFSANVQAASRTVGGRSSGTVTIGNESVPLHGAEATQRAMQDGTALTVQCLACDNWMQVTKEATMMFCPVCSTVSPVVIPETGPGGAAAASSSPGSNQLSEDMALAEALQQEEYKMAERQEERRKNRGAAAGAGAGAAAKPADASSQGWMEWLGLSSSASPTATASSPERPASFAQPPAQRGYQAVTLPPGSSTATRGSESHSSSSPSRMLAAQTETVRFEEDDDLLLNRGRVAAQKPLFSCVADSITSAATSLYTTSLPEDDEGNVHGVDSSSLLAVTNYRREEEKK
jgi:hypothetical protein